MSDNQDYENQETRENIYTQFARMINDFSNHKVTKEDLYNGFVAMVEMCGDEEKHERQDYEDKIKAIHSESGPGLIAVKMPYSNWKEGLKKVQ